MSSLAPQTVHLEATSSAAVVAHLRGMRTALRILAISALVFTLWIGAYGGIYLLQAAGLTSVAGGVAGSAYLVLVAAVFFPARLLWSQADAASRFVAAPSDELFATFTREVRRFWRVSTWAAACVLLLTVGWTLFLVLVAMQD